ncbi:hypothetical protein BJX61DRAFT_538801 [Aspergillus egyptiacus]|nr:hypothetical protein BJX61DRAFT_538801 [Aspergillus egyptiacus]
MASSQGGFPGTADFAAPNIGVGIPLACGPTDGPERPEHVRFTGRDRDTAARLTGDGRLDINIREDETRVADYLEALTKQPSPAKRRPYPVPEDLKFPVKLNVVIHVVGSRGDVQPFIVLGQALKQHGHRVRLATHLVFRDFVKEHGLEFFNIGGDPTQLMSFMVKNPKLIPKMETVVHGDLGKRRREIRHIIAGCWRSCIEAGEGLSLACDEALTAPPFVADAIIANPPSFAHIHCAEKLGIPLHLMFTMPWSPTQAFPHPLANIQTSNTNPSLAKVASYAVTEMLMWQGLGDLQNQFRRFELGLEPLDSMRAPSLIHRLRIPFTYMWSPSLLPKPPDWHSHIDVTGFHFLASDKTYQPPAYLVTFLESGPPPIYIGFGSIVVDDPENLTRTILDAVRQTGQRALISQGWGGLGAENFGDANIFVIGNCPHDWLFKHVSCVVHHGGAGTTAIGLALGRPTTIIPFFGDQPFWGALVAVNKAGPWPIPFSKLTAERLADAIRHCLEPETVSQARALSERIRSENGPQKALASFHRQLDLRRIQCSFCPDRPAVWRLRRPHILLSPLAASVLVRGGYLDPHDLKLYRAKHYDTNTDPRGPFCAGVEGITGAIGNFVSGIFNLPVSMVQGFSKPAHKRFADEYQLPSCGERIAAAEAAQSAALHNDTDGADANDKPTTGTTGTGHGLSRTASRETTATATTTSSTWSSQEGPTMAAAMKRRGSVAASDLLENTSYTGRRLVNWIIEIPMGIALLVSQEFHEFPRFYHDRTVRDTPVVSGVRSGFTAAGKELGYECYDAITGVVTQPHTGWREGGLAGMAKGVGKGAGGLVLKPQAGIWGLIGYPLNGVFRSIEKSYGADREDYIVASRIRQGDDDLAAATEEERNAIVERWRLIERQMKAKKSRKRRRES